jgi:hypothetical protein
MHWDADSCNYLSIICQQPADYARPWLLAAAAAAAVPHPKAAA